MDPQRELAVGMLRILSNCDFDRGGYDLATDVALREAIDNTASII